MKFISAAVIAVIANVQAVQYAVSEGPTKADNGEADDVVLPRTLDDDKKWTNPLSLSDTGADDESVLAQLTTQKHHHKKHHKKHHAKKRDAYDNDPTSTSPYDS